MQSTYNLTTEFARNGMYADSRIMRHTNSRIATTPIRAGFGVFRVPGYGAPGPTMVDPGQVWQTPNPLNAASATGIMTGGAAATTAQAITSSQMNGVSGQAEMFPARPVTITFSADASWLATTATLTYINHLNATVSESIAIPAGGGVTRTTTGSVKKIISFTIPAQGGTAGTYTIGYAVFDATVTGNDFEGVAAFDAAADVSFSANQPSNLAEYGPGSRVNCLWKGAIWVTTEDAVSAGGDVFLRIGGSGILGAFRGAADGGNTIQLSGRYQRDSAVSGLNIAELY